MKTRQAKAKARGSYSPWQGVNDPRNADVKRQIVANGIVVEEEKLTGTEAAAAWMSASLDHLEKALEWITSNRRCRKAKFAHYMRLSNKASANAAAALAAQPSTSSPRRSP